MTCLDNRHWILDGPTAIGVPRLARWGSRSLLKQQNKGQLKVGILAARTLAHERQWRF